MDKRSATAAARGRRLVLFKKGWIGIQREKGAVVVLVFMEPPAGVLTVYMKLSWTSVLLRIADATATARWNEWWLSFEVGEDRRKQETGEFESV